jgi:hypothetical protein
LSIWILILIRYFAKKDISQSSSTQVTIFADAPITTEEADILNRKVFVENLKDIISAHPLKEESVRICIDAKWGEGKTSVFNLLKERLEEKNTICIDFNPWYYNNEESALKGLIKLLGNAVSNQHPYPSANDDTDKLIKAIVGGACNKFLGITFEKDKDIQKSLISISESVEKTRKKYVIFIDDLDRLDAPAIKNILKMIMVMSEIKSLIFVIAASTEHICDNKEISKEYIEKMMTIILPLPTISLLKIREYFRKEFDKIIKEENFSQKEDEIIKDRRIQESFLSLKKLCICNLRYIKRVLETFKLLYRPLAGEVDVVDFIFIVYLYIYFPKIVTEIYNNRFKIVKEPFSLVRDDIDKGRAFESIHEDKENRGNTCFEDFIGSYPLQDDKKDLRIILSAMFPKFKSKEYWGGNYYKHAKAIADGRYFYRYFNFFVDKKVDIPDKEIEKRIRMWKVKDCVHDIRKVLEQYRNDGLIEFFFEKLEDKKELAGAELLKVSSTITPIALR